jgi:hypothetical protein
MRNNLEESNHGLVEVLSRHLPEETEQNHEKPVRTDGVPAEIRADYLSNKSL